MKMDKQVFIGLFFAGICAFLVPIFVHLAWVNLLAKVIGGALLLIAMIYLISGDVLARKFGKQKGLTPEQIMQKKRDEYKAKIEEADLQLQLEKKRAEIAKLKNPAKNETEKKPDLLDNMKDFMIK
jgi:hypothetical protein